VQVWVPAVSGPGGFFCLGSDTVFTPGQVLTPGGADAAGRRHPGSSPDYVYFTAVVPDAVAHGAHLYQVEPVGAFEQDTGCWDEGFRTAAGVKVVRELAWG
jgi:hypothetical protein